MSGPKVIRIVTREEMEKRCQVQITKLEKEIERLKTFAEKNKCFDENLEQELANRLQRFKQQDASEYAQLERDIPQQLKFLQQTRKSMEENIEKKAIVSRKSFNNLLRIRKQLLEYCKSGDIAVPASIENAPNGLFLEDSTLAEFRQKVNEAQAALFSPKEVQGKPLTPEQEAIRKRLGMTLQSLSFDQWKEKMDATEDAPQVTRLNKLLAQLKVLEESDSAFAGFATSANSLLEDIHNPYYTAKCDSLIIEVSRYIEKSRTFTKQKQAVSDLFLEIEEYLSTDSSSESHQAYKNLKSEFASCEIATIESISQRATTLRDAVKVQFEGESRRRVLLEGLADLGYAVNETLETAWVKEGSLVVAKNDQESYGVELVGNTALDKCQVRVVGAEDRNTDADKAAEETWCDDFASMRKKLSNSGAEISVQKATLVGEAPLKVYSEDDNRWNKRMGAPKRDGRYLKH